MSVAVSGLGQVYHIGPWRRWGLAAWIIVPADIGAVAGRIFLFLLAFALAGQWLIDRAQLEISPAGGRLWNWGAMLVVLAVAFGLWAFGMAMPLVSLLGRAR